MDDAAQLFADFRDYCQERIAEKRKLYPDYAIEHIPLHPPVPPLDTEEEAPIVDLIKRVSGHQETSTVAFAAEAGQFSNAGFPSVICGPGDIAQAHRANEFVSVEQLEGCMQMIKHLARELSR